MVGKRAWNPAPYKAGIPPLHIKGISAKGPVNPSIWILVLCWSRKLHDCGKIGNTVNANGCCWRFGRILMDDKTKVFGVRRPFRRRIWIAVRPTYG